MDGQAAISGSSQARGCRDWGRDVTPCEWCTQHGGWLDEAGTRPAVVSQARLMANLAATGAKQFATHPCAWRQTLFPAKTRARPEPDRTSAKLKHLLQSCRAKGRRGLRHNQPNAFSADGCANYSQIQDASLSPSRSSRELCLVSA